jgi:hypothetical protein
MVRNARGAHAEALEFLKQARPHHAAALKADPANATYRLFYRNNLQTVAGSYMGLADHARLAAAAEELARAGLHAADDPHLAACYLGRCVELAARDAKLDEGKRKELAQAYGDRALALLRQARDRGYKNTARWKTEPDLAALRPRADFQQLLKDVAAVPKGGAALAVGKPLEEALTKDDPTDTFPLTAKSHARVHTVELEAAQPYLIDLQGEFDTFLRVEDSQKKPLLFNDDVRPDDLNSRLAFVPPQKGTYRVVVTAYKPGDTGRYRLSVRPAAVDGKPIRYQDRLEKTDKANQGKFFKTHKLTLRGGGAYALELMSPDFNTCLVLLDEQGRVLASNDGVAPGQPRKARLDFTPREDGTFLLMATSAGPQETGAYAITVERYVATAGGKSP